MSSITKEIEALVDNKEGFKFEVSEEMLYAVLDAITNQENLSESEYTRLKDAECVISVMLTALNMAKGKQIKMGYRAIMGFEFYLKEV